MESYRPTWVEINLDNIASNFKGLRSLIKNEVKFCCIIKANGYGHGSVELAKFYEELGADYFGVATGKEALELRRAGIKTDILCLGYTHESVHKVLIENDIDIPVYSFETAENLSRLAGRLGRTVSIHIKLDTGMSRIGLQCNDDTVKIIEKIKMLDNVHLRGLFTHFARADEIQRDTTREQFERYEYVRRRLEDIGIVCDINHVCNSAGTIMYPEYHLDMVRVGISLYGHYPSDEVDKSRVKLYPAMTLKSMISHVKNLEKGRGIGYGHKYVTVNDGEYIATMPIGYADGFTRMLSKDANVMINGKIYKLAGNICMDQCMIKVDDKVNVGDVVTIFGEDDSLRVERFADKLGTISYEILCMVQRRIPRVYKSDDKLIKVVDYLLD
ncbi:MAG: alanine racemase [Filifactoraceae bacterium]